MMAASARSWSATMTRPTVPLAVSVLGFLILLSLLARAVPPAAPAQDVPLPAVPEGFEIGLFAAAPQIHSPASMAVASPRVVFVGEDDFNTGGHEGFVCRCEDTDGDGRADRLTVFARGLNAPQGMTFVHDTLYVVHAPLLSAFRDTDGDGVADVREDLVQGLGPAPKDLVHHIPSGIR